MGGPRPRGSSACLFGTMLHDLRTPFLPTACRSSPALTGRCCPASLLSVCCRSCQPHYPRPSYWGSCCSLCWSGGTVVAFVTWPCCPHLGENVFFIWFCLGNARAAVLKARQRGRDGWWVVVCWTDLLCAPFWDGAQACGEEPSLYWENMLPSSNPRCAPWPSEHGLASTFE